MTDRLITADASKVSASDFLDAILGMTHEKRAEQRQYDIETCIRAIERSDTYGWPPCFVAECREIMRERAVPYDRQRLDECPENHRPRWAA